MFFKNVRKKCSQRMFVKQLRIKNFQLSIKVGLWSENKLNKNCEEVSIIENW